MTNIMYKQELLLPGKVERVTAGDDFNDFAIDRKAVVAGRFDIGFKDTEGGVVFEKVRGLLDTASVVDGNHVKRGILPSVPASQEIPSNSSETIDGHLQLGLDYSPFVLVSTSLNKNAKNKQADVSNHR